MIMKEEKMQWCKARQPANQSGITLTRRKNKQGEYVWPPRIFNPWGERSCPEYFLPERSLGTRTRGMPAMPGCCTYFSFQFCQSVASADGMTVGVCDLPFNTILWRDTF